MPRAILFGLMTFDMMLWHLSRVRDVIAWQDMQSASMISHNQSLLHVEICLAIGARVQTSPLIKSHRLGDEFIETGHLVCHANRQMMIAIIPRMQKVGRTHQVTGSLLLRSLMHPTGNSLIACPPAIL